METPERRPRNKHLDSILSQLTPVKVPPSPLLKQLGYGTGVNVYQLNRSPKNGKIMSPWALKRVSKRWLQRSTEEYESRMTEEAEILRTLSHPNIVGFRAMIKTSDGRENLAMECFGVSLCDLLEAKTDDGDWEPLPASKIKRMCLDICKALNYLHNVAKILHGDIKSPNVLVKGDFESCKLCDFGVTLPLNEHNEVDFEKNPDACYIGTKLWSAPETLKGVITDKSDIFSFGLVTYETIALIPPHTWVLHESKGIDSEELTPENVNDDRVDELLGTRPPLLIELSEEYDSIIEIFYLCTNHLSEDRPSAKGLLEALITQFERK